MLKARLVGITGRDGRLGTLLKGSPGDTPISLDPSKIIYPTTSTPPPLPSQIVSSPADIFGKFQSQERRKVGAGHPDEGSHYL